MFRFLLAFLIVIAGCSKAAPPAPSPRAKPVVVVDAIVGDLHGVAEAVGEVRSAHDATLSSEALGRVIMLVEEGARVKKGEIVARLEPDRAAAVSAGRGARVAGAQSEAAQKKRELERLEKLLAEGAISRQELERATTAAATAGAALGAAEADALDAGVSLRDRTIRSPFAGIVLEKNAEVGEIVSPGTPLLRVAQDSSIEVAVFLGEADALRVTAGAIATIFFDALEGETYAGVVHRIDQVLVAGARTAEAIIRFDPKTGTTAPRLPPGLLARVRIIAETRARALIIPHEAIQTDPEGAAVWVITGNRSQSRRVRIGLRGLEGTEILDGLSAGDRVVIRGAEAIKDGDLVEASK